MLLHKTPNHAKFCGDQLKNANIRDREFVLPEKWAKVHQKILGKLPPKTSHHAKFQRDRSYQLGDRGWLGKKFQHTDRQTDTRHPNWLSRALQHVRGATKKEKKERN